MWEATQLLKEYPEVTPTHLAKVYFHSIYNSVHSQKFMWLGMVTGKHRVGKSVNTAAALSLLDRTFYRDMEIRTVYYADQFLKALNKIRKEEIIGGAIMWDEAGVGIPAREWYEVSNKTINAAVQVAGYLRPIIMLVTHDITYIDSQPRKLLSSFWIVKRPSSNYSEIYPYTLRINRRTGKVYFEAPRVRYVYPDGAVGMRIAIRKIRFYKPPQELIDRYDAISEPWKAKILEQAEEKVRKYSEGTLPKREWTEQQIIDFLLKNWRAFRPREASPTAPSWTHTPLSRNLNYR